MESREEKQAFDRYKTIIDILREANDKRGISLVEELVQKCVNYVLVVTNAETVGKSQRFHQENDDQIREKLVNLDKVRRLAHEALIAQLNIVNRYLFKQERIKEKGLSGGIFSLNPHAIRDRNAIGDWHIL